MTAADEPIPPSTLDIMKETARKAFETTVDELDEARRTRDALNERIAHLVRVELDLRRVIGAMNRKPRRKTS